jgi:phosphoglycolate phosphatase-like HAD superfamily hydrolase
VRPLAIFDIDGVLADVRHRVHHLEGRRKDWGAFFQAAPRDGVHPEGLALALEAARECDIAYVTGRPEWIRAETSAWLAAHGLPAGDLAMRRRGDHRPAAQAKLRLLEQVAAGRTVAVIVDDDLDVCDAYEAAGFAVLRATWAPRSAALHTAQEKDGRT